VEHVQQACALPPPFPPPQALSPSLQQAVGALAANESSIEQIWQERLLEMRHCISQHAEAESTLNGRVHPRIREHVSKFPSLAFEALLQKYGYDDPSAARLLKGSELVGDLAGRPIWPENTHSGPRNSELSLLADSVDARASLWNSIRPNKHDSELLAAAEADVANGKMLGPFFCDNDLSGVIGSREFVLSRRFAVEQSDKVRPCDDFTASGINACCRPSRKLQLSTLDSFFALVSSIVLAFPNLQPGNVQFWKRDQESAYRQFALSISALVFASVIFWHHAEERPVAYVHLALPFGPIASVIEYNRISQAITYLCNKMFYLCCDSYFDDFWGVAPAHLARRTFEVFGEVQSLLNCTIKIAKDLLPTVIGELLGHISNLSSIPYTICNTVRRKLSIGKLIQDALRSGILRPSTAGEVAGKFGFACTALYGRVGRAALKPVYERQHSSHIYIDKQLRAALQCILQIMNEAPPRAVLPSFLSSRRSSVAYTDGQGAGWIAAVIFPGAPFKPFYSAMQLPSDLVSRFPRGSGRCGRANAIEQIETCAVVLLLEVFGDVLLDSDLRLFVDNIAEQGSLIRGFSRSHSQAVLCGAVWKRVARLRVGLWVDRVESAANIADIPTRPEKVERFETLRNLGVQCRVFPQSRFVARLRAELSEGGIP